MANILTGAKIIMETLIANGVDTLFGYPGGTVLNIYDEIFKAQSLGRITHYISCHEQGASHAADGYSRATGKTGVVIATSGPGATNLVTGIATAYLDSTPLIAITGNVATSLIGRDSFQEVDITGITMPITKHNFFIKDISKLEETINKAFEIANTGRPGPVLIDIPKDVQTGVFEYKGDIAKVNQTTKINDEYLKKAIELIKNAERPFIYAGGGVVLSNASETLLDFANLIDAPIGTSMMGLTAVPHTNKRFLGMTGMHGKFVSSKVMSMSDLIIAIGTRFSDRATGNKIEFSKDRKVIHIDIDPAEIGKNIPAYVSVIGDVKVILNALINRIEVAKRTKWNETIDKIKSHPDNHLEMDKTKLTPQVIIEKMAEKSKGNCPVATDVGQHQMWVAQYYKFSKPRTFITSGGLGTMGFGLGSAIGATIGWLNKGEKNFKTIHFTSDGSFHMNLNEMATVVSNNLPIIIVVMNNNSLGMVRQWQTLFFEKRYSNTTLNRYTDYVKLAEAFGARGFRVTSLHELDNIINLAFEEKGPVLIDAHIDPDEKVLPMIPPGGTIDDIILRG